MQAFWTAPAERSDDGAFTQPKALDSSDRSCGRKSGVASHLPPQSKNLPVLRFGEVRVSPHFPN